MAFHIEKSGVGSYDGWGGEYEEVAGEKPLEGRYGEEFVEYAVDGGYSEYVV